VFSLVFFCNVELEAGPTPQWTMEAIHYVISNMDHGGANSRSSFGEAKKKIISVRHTVACKTTPREHISRPSLQSAQCGFSSRITVSRGKIEAFSLPWSTTPFPCCLDLPLVGYILPLQQPHRGK